MAVLVYNNFWYGFHLEIEDEEKKRADNEPFFFRMRKNINSYKIIKTAITKTSP